MFSPDNAVHSPDCTVTRRLSHAGIASKRLNVSRTFFTFGYSHTILVFLYQTSWQFRRVRRYNQCVECRGYEKFMIFDQYWPMTNVVQGIPFTGCVNQASLFFFDCVLSVLVFLMLSQICFEFVRTILPSNWLAGPCPNDV